MVTLTDLAVSTLQRVLANSAAAQGLRIQVADGGCAGGSAHQMGLEAGAGDDDTVLEYGDVKVFIDAGQHGPSERRNRGLCRERRRGRVQVRQSQRDIDLRLRVLLLDLFVQHQTPLAAPAEGASHEAGHSCGSGHHH